MADYNIRAVLSATDKGFSSGLNNAAKSVASLGMTVKSGLGFGVLTGVGQRCFDALASGASDVMRGLSESSATWKTFEGTMKNFGSGSKEISKVKKEMQDFAEKTIYSSSDMATTFSQLAAVGIKSADKLVTGFGGLASAAENPQQAMKTLSQQATQMAAKPSVAWQDFKLMLEQTPAGIAAVAKQMGMTTTELVSNVQSGTVSTNDFFEAIEKVGNSDAWQKQATEYKTAGQAMDGLVETITNQLQPAYDAVSKKAIDFISTFSDSFGKINAQAIADKLTGWMDKAAKYINAFKQSFSGVGQAFGSAINAIKESMSGLDGSFGSAESVDSFKNAMSGAADALKKLAGFMEDHSETIGAMIKQLPKLAAAFGAFKVLSTVTPFVSSFGKTITGMAKAGLGKLAGKLFTTAAAEKAVGSASTISSTQTKDMAISLLAMGGAVLLCSVGFALLAQSAVAIANGGAGAIEAMTLMIIGIAGLAGVFAKLGPQLTANAVGMITFGGAVLLVGAGMFLMGKATAEVAKGGKLAIVTFGLMMAGIIGLVTVVGVFGASLTAAAPGLVALAALVIATGFAFNLATPFVEALGDAISQVINAIGDAVSGIFNSFANVIKQIGIAAERAGTGIEKTAHGIKILVGLPLGDTAGTLIVVAGAIKRLANSSDGLNTLASGLNSTAGGLKNSAAAGMTASASFAGSASACSLLGAASNRLSETFRSSMSSVSSAARSMTQGVLAAFSGASSGARYTGTMIGVGLANGMASQLGRVRSIATQLAAAANEAIVAKAKIGSPSKVTRYVGRMYGEGLVVGMKAVQDKVYDTASDLVYIPKGIDNGATLAYNSNLSDSYDYAATVSGVIEVPVNLDGKQVAVVTAPYMGSQLSTIETRQRRKRGTR